MLWECDQYPLAGFSPRDKDFVLEDLVWRGASLTPAFLHRALLIQRSLVVGVAGRLAGFEVFADASGRFIHESLVLITLTEVDIDDVYIELNRGPGVTSAERRLFRFLAGTRNQAVQMGSRPNCFCFARDHREREQLAAYCQNPVVASYLDKLCIGRVVSRVA